VNHIGSPQKYKSDSEEDTHKVYIPCLLLFFFFSQSSSTRHNHNRQHLFLLFFFSEYPSIRYNYSQQPIQLTSTTMSMNNPPTVKPAAFGGYGRQKGPYGSLENLEFVSKCPPDIQRNTRIVAVCGIPASRAAPQDDGWFYSEFFLFYQMLKSRSKYKYHYSSS
jgi:hypothetical protein